MLMYVVLRGKVAISVGEKLVETVGPGGIFGEMALVDRTPRLASCLVESDVKLLAINRAAFLNLVKHSRRFATSLLAAVSARARYAAARWRSRRSQTKRPAGAAVLLAGALDRSRATS